MSIENDSEEQIFAKLEESGEKDRYSKRLICYCG